jgi:hypothetical protein
MLREAGRPPSIKDMALGALAAKGVRFPDRRIMKTNRVKLRFTFAELQARGMSQCIGTGTPRE